MENRLLLLIAVLFFCACSSSPQRSGEIYPPSERGPDGVVREPHSLKFLMWPVARHKVTQEFKDESVAKKRTHDGIDISAPTGTRIYAPASGTVIYAGQKFRGYGKMIMIEHSPLFTTLFGHCKKLFVKSGEPVKRGELIALVGRTGRATAPHLHFEVRVKREPVDPLTYLE